MKTLNLHCDYIKFNALKKALKSIEDIAPNQAQEGESKDCLVVLTAVEKGDTKESLKVSGATKNRASDFKLRAEQKLKAIEKKLTMDETVANVANVGDAAGLG